MDFHTHIHTNSLILCLHVYVYFDSQYLSVQLVLLIFFRIPLLYDFSTTTHGTTTTNITTVVITTRQRHNVSIDVPSKVCNSNLTLKLKLTEQSRSVTERTLVFRRHTVY